MFLLYQLIMSLILLVSPLIIIYRILNKKEDTKRYIEKFSIHTKKRRVGKLIWFHCASVGEILSILPLVKYYEKNKTIDQILVTSVTLSSSKVFKKYNFKKTIHQFFPIDHIFLVNKFLNYWKPSLSIFVDSEIWPYMLKKLDNKNIPIILLNGRITYKTFKKWIIVRSFAKSIFKKISFAYPQNLETKKYLKKLSVKKINLIGNLKYAESYEKNTSHTSNNLKSIFKNKNVWVASSTHDDEEVFCARTHLELKKRVRNLVTIIIPRHIHRVKNILQMLKKFNLKIALHSSKIKNLKNADIYIVDSFGDTKVFHKIGSSVFLGGSIIKGKGGQNPLEAARFGAKILHGPNVDNFTDVYKLLKSLNVSKKIKSPNELASSIIFKKNKITGNKIKKIGDKILKKTINELDTLINNEPKKNLSFGIINTQVFTHICYPQ